MRRRTRVMAAALLAGVLTATAAPLATAVPSAAHGEAVRSRPGDPVQARLDALVARDGVPGALAYGGGRTWTAGTAELGTDRPMVGADASVRLASDTKPFTAVAVMRLVSEGGLGLDDRAGRYLPQLADSRVTVRQLLKQRSGLTEYTALVDWASPLDEAGYLQLAIDHGQDFAPGTRWGYSNTNYLALGMIIEQVTGGDFRTYIDKAILRPLRLDHTYWPAEEEFGLRGPHAHNYGVSPADPGAGVVDVTELPGYQFGASGGLVSTPRDLNAFWDGLFGGRLLPARTLRLMTHDTSDVGGRDVYPRGSRYGYGLASFPLSCGGVYWGHGGDLPGNSVEGGRASGGRGTVTVYTTTWTAEGRPLRRVLAAADAALCAGTR
ncbi:serine hydrolase domain-containing protein [Streptomyces sp. NPDC007088]|uniref:serine hydrolase domain-containing protein n=1 Tax=Streptomyces sp. NPDC007088 TaxID=3364773 RepID=UPI0036911B87